ncbi:MAG: chlorite dismutase family protein [Chloroflexota bacterium]
MAEQTPPLDLSEKGKDKEGQVITLNRRLYMQFMAYGHCTDTSAVADAMQNARVAGALYLDLNDPQGIGLVTMHEDPNHFITDVRQMLNTPAFASLQPKPEFAMFGRTYAIGYENDLEEAVIDRPTKKVLNPELKWAIWYPLRRQKNFELLSGQEQGKILMEHGGIGMRFGRAGLATDIRLACHGLDKNDNDFVVGLLGRDLHPLSAVVQRMRKTKQTAEHLESLGPFFIGQVVWQSG